jgi:uncharacterized protein involved in exopolysaccharide biosynthesis
VRSQAAVADWGTPVVNYKSGPEDLQLADYTSVLRRGWWLIVMCAILGILGGLTYYKTAHKVYTATASVYVTGTSQNVNQVTGGRTTGSVNLDTEAQVVQSAAVAQAATKLMHSTESLQQVLSRVSVTVPANSQVLSINCRATTAAKAATCAQSFAQAYLNYSAATTTASINAQLSALQSSISSLESASAKLTIEAASLPSNSSQRAADEEQLNSDHSQLGSLNSEVAQLTTDLADPSAGSIISAAALPHSPTSPRLLLVVSSGLVAGLLIGLVLAFIIDRRDRRIRGPRDLAQFGVPVLMSLPLKRSTPPELAIASSRSQLGRNFAELAHVVAGSLGSGNHVLLVTGASGGRGTSLVAANLAVALSRNQPDVTLICADLEDSAIPGMVGLPAGPGLTDMLTNHGLPEGDAGCPVAVAPRLRVITPGSAAGMNADDIQQDAVERLITSLHRMARWIVVEAPPMTSGPDVYTLAQVADTAVVAVEVPHTRSDQLRRGIQHLDRMRTAVLGAVLLPTPTPPSRGSGSLSADGSNVRPEQPRTSAITASGDAPAIDHDPYDESRATAAWSADGEEDDEATAIIQVPRAKPRS